jgi:hypothetical protein
MKTKYHRVDDANTVIRAIASHGRRFFYSPDYDRYGRFMIDLTGSIRFIDDHTGSRVRIVKGGKWRGFHNGGTCRAIVEALAEYIRTGKTMSRGFFGPWPDWINDGDMWGYGAEEMEKVRRDAFASPAVYQIDAALIGTEAERLKENVG